jgi:hypothetical protein
LQSGFGISAVLGGGLMGFTDQTMRNRTSSVGGMWNLRVTIGSHAPLALELGYVGSAIGLNGLPHADDGTLIGTDFEGDLRFNILPHNDWNPFIFAGMGWERFDVTGTDVTLAVDGINDHDDLMVFPMGAGVNYRKDGFVAELRGTFRAAAFPDLVLKSPWNSSGDHDDNDHFAPMHTWEASASIGYEY